MIDRIEREKGLNFERRTLPYGIPSAQLFPRGYLTAQLRSKEKFATELTEGTEEDNFIFWLYLGHKFFEQLFVSIKIVLSKRASARLFFADNQVRTWQQLKLEEDT